MRTETHAGPHTMPQLVLSLWTRQKHGIILFVVSLFHGTVFWTEFWQFTTRESEVIEGYSSVTALSIIADGREETIFYRLVKNKEADIVSGMINGVKREEFRQTVRIGCAARRAASTQLQWSLKLTELCTYISTWYNNGSVWCWNYQNNSSTQQLWLSGCISYRAGFVHYAGVSLSC